MAERSGSAPPQKSRGTGKPGRPVADILPDRLSIEGHPFVGPAGRVLDKALDEAGIDRRLVYLTSILRARDDDSRREAMDQFVGDLRIVAAEIARAPRDRAGSR